jgi:hypothetical protein
MKELYPFFEFYFKDIKEKGHPQSMNIIRNYVKTPYIFHLEDDWKFFVKRDYIKDSIDIIESNKSIGQCLFNKNYAEIESDIDIKGGIYHTTNSGLRYFIHEYCRTQTEAWMKTDGTQVNVDKIAVSNTFTQEWEMEPYFELAKKYGYKTFSIIVENRHGNKSIHNVPEDKVKMMKDRFEIKI